MLKWAVLRDRVIRRDASQQAVFARPQSKVGYNKGLGDRGVKRDRAESNDSDRKGAALEGRKGSTGKQSRECGCSVE